MIRLASPLFVLVCLAAACSSNLDRPVDGGAPTDAGGETDTGSDPGDAGDAGDAGDTGTTMDGGLPRAPWGAVSLNLHCLETGGTAFTTNEERFAAIADRAVSGGARVLLLQEACNDGAVSALDVLERALEAASGREWHGSFAFAHVAWEGTPQEADEGVAMLADVPLSDVRVLEHGALGSLRRVMLSAALGGDLTGLRVGTFHLDHADEAVRRLQARELAVAGLVHGGSASVLLGGDLNDREGSAAYTALGEAGYVDTSSALRGTRIDHVFVHRGAGIGATSAELVFDGTGER
ncbi:MAG: endonuclease/exonuclease/phosphatase family protein, partial [Deltaproteobacteria bacterium]|nr:endonuclease/exonuclease/phosphatase family protein [Deltaproteobacteria bacterium]